MVEVRSGTVVMFSDVGCPWASLAVHRLRRRRAELGLDDAVVIDHRCFPLELINRQVTPKTIVDAEVAVVGSHEPSLGWRPWVRAERAYPSTTLLALEAVQAAKTEEVGGLRAGEELDAALRRAWYAESHSIHLYAEIIDIAGSCDAVKVDALDAALRRGVGRAEVFAQWRQAEDIAVQGSPHLYLADGFDVHNPGITLSWTGGQFHGMPVIEDDRPAVYDEILRRAAAAG
ncbi:MAG: dithiol-disulfide isomerase [Streptosporangiales bacterium]|nr:dithiol-disulfide isomerase [Streptosporangiales bacterium]